MRSIALAFVFLFIGSGAARADTLLIAGGGKAPADADAALRSMVVPDAVRLAPGMPRIAKSDDYAGLNPGFHIVVVGRCRDAASAAAALDLLRVLVPGAYAKDVKGPAADESCPGVSLEKPERGFAIKEHTPVRAGVPGVEWVVVEKPSSEKGPCALPEVAVELRRKSQVVEHMTLMSLCVPPDKNDPLGMSKSSSARFSTAGEFTFVEITETTWAADHSSNEGEVYAFCKTGMVKIAELGNEIGNATSSLEAEATQPDPARPLVRIAGTDGPGELKRFDPVSCSLTTVAEAAAK